MLPYFSLSLISATKPSNPRAQFIRRGASLPFGLIYAPRPLRALAAASPFFLRSVRNGSCEYAKTPLLWCVASSPLKWLAQHYRFLLYTASPVPPSTCRNSVHLCSSRQSSCSPSGPFLAAGREVNKLLSRGAHVGPKLRPGQRCACVSTSREKGFGLSRNGENSFAYTRPPRVPVVGRSLRGHSLCGKLPAGDRHSYERVIRLYSFRFVCLSSSTRIGSRVVLAES